MRDIFVKMLFNDKLKKILVMSVSVFQCVSVCIRKHIIISGTSRPIFNKFLFMSSIILAVARSSSGGVAICYVHPVYG